MISSVILLITLLNFSRTSSLPVLPALYIDVNLASRAESRADYLCWTDQWSHVYWQDSFVGLFYGYHGENLARKYSDMKKLNTAFLASPEHRDNMLSPNYTNIGVGQSCDITVELFGG